jgi:hypothetical protein
MESTFPVRLKKEAFTLHGERDFACMGKGDFGVLLPCLWGGAGFFVGLVGQVGLVRQVGRRRD